MSALAPIAILAAFAFTASAATLGPVAVLVWAAGATAACILDPPIERAIARWQRGHRHK